MTVDTTRYGAGLAPTVAAEHASVGSAAELLCLTVQEIGRRAPTIAAAAAVELGGEVLVLHFSDGSAATLEARYGGLSVTPSAGSGTVECFFSDRSLQELFDLERRPSEALAMGALDVRGSTAAVLATWRTFQLLAQRASGLRFVQAIWTTYRAERGLDAPSAAALPLSPGRAYPIPDASALLRGTEDWVAKSASMATTRVLWDGRDGAGWWTLPGPIDADLPAVLESCRRRTAREINDLIPVREPRATLYDLMRSYPNRGGKGLRPTLCMATCGAFRGQADDAVRISAAIEMFHNAFLIHDDIEDESDLRRGEDCLHIAHGIGLAVNAGDGMNLAALEVVLSNIERLGLARTLGLIHEIIHMCRETIEGQAIELGWIRSRVVPPDDEDYFHMVTKKTGWYTCMSPCRLGAIAAGHTRPRELDLLAEVFHKVGVAFQIQDDLLNLIGEEALYGKEALGDLLEGKRTLMLIHLMRTMPEPERAEWMEWLSLPRPRKELGDARRLLERMHHYGSIEHARKVAARFAALGGELFESKLGFLAESEPKAILRQVVHYVITREL